MKKIIHQYIKGILIMWIMPELTDIHRYSLPHPHDRMRRVAWRMTKK